MEQFAKTWTKYTTDKHILDMVKHCHIEFDTIPAQNAGAPQIKFNETERENLALAVHDLKKVGVIEECEHETGEFISHIFGRPKKDGSMRVILNLKQLNEHVTYQHFKMDTRQMAARLITEGCYMASVDLKQAYYMIPIAEEHRKYLKFKWEGKLFQFTSLPNGLACAPRLFTKLLKPVFATLQSEGHCCLGYIDDTILVAQTKAECEAGVKRMIEVLQELGFLINYEKSVLEPTQKLTFLGYVFDSNEMTITLGQEKVDNIVSACSKLLSKDTTTIREVARTVGLMVAYSEGAELGRLHYRQLEFDKNVALQQNYGDFDKHMHISNEARLDLTWWVENSCKQQCQIWRPQPTQVIVSDASLTGWGGIFESQITGGDWDLQEQMLHINVLEMKGAFYALKSFCKTFKNCHIRLRLDNTTAVAYINHMGGSKSLACNEIAKEMWAWCLDRNIWLSAAHVPGTENIADSESRRQHDYMEWKLDSNIFKHIVSKLGTPKIDLFASRLNNQLPRYVAYKPDPSAEHIDAFTMCWGNTLMYAFPPFSVIDRCLQKIQQEEARVIMVVPHWPTRPWWAILNQLMDREPILINKASKHLRHPVTGEIHPMPKLTLMACLVSGENWRRKRSRIAR